MRGQNVKLESLRENDSEILFDWINDRDLVILNAPYSPVGEHAHQEWFKSVQVSTDSVIFSIRKCMDDAIIGSCQLGQIRNVHRTAQLQIRIGLAQERGRGFGTEAVKLLVAFGFRDLNLHRIGLTVFAENVAARKAYVNAGFVEEGCMRKAVWIDGEYRDLIVMGILNNGRD